MSTRATYHFLADGPHVPSTAIYIHYDGFPDGAARHLWTIFTGAKQRGCMATRLLANCEFSELTVSHAAHSDTEYRYTIANQRSGLNADITCEARINFGDAWTTDADCTVRDFLELHPRQLGKLFTPFLDMSLGYANRTLNLQLAAREVVRCCKMLEIWEGNGACVPRSANWQSLAGQLNALLEAWPQLAVDEAARRFAATYTG